MEVFMGELDDFLISRGYGKPKPSEQPATSVQTQSTKDDTVKWLELIRPTTVDLILGHKGRGKSGLGYFLLDMCEKHYNLTPHVVNLPDDKHHLLPCNYTFGNLEDVKKFRNSAVLIDEGTCELPTGSKLEVLLKGYQSLSRQRNQIIIIIFHASSDVGSRILRGVDTVMIKEPSKRQIQHGSKDKWWHDILMEAKSKFKTIADMGDDVRKYTFIDSDEPEFQGMLSNSVPSYWNEELSCAFGETGDSGDSGDSDDGTLMSIDGQAEITAEMRARGVAMETVTTPSGNYRVFMDPFDAKITWMEK
jgi:hypothetical protein